MKTPSSAQPDRSQRLILLGRSQDAEDDHDRAIHARYGGVTRDLLDADKARWTRIGGGLAALARQVCNGCLATAFGDTSPKLAHVTARLSEAIDDQIGQEAWPVVDAAARLAAIES